MVETYRTHAIYYIIRLVVMIFKNRIFAHLPRARFVFTTTAVRPSRRGRGRPKRNRLHIPIIIMTIIIIYSRIFFPRAPSAFIVVVILIAFNTVARATPAGGTRETITYIRGGLEWHLNRSRATRTTPSLE